MKNKFIVFIFIITSFFINAETLKIKAVGDVMLGSFTPAKIIPRNPVETYSHLSEYFKNCDLAIANLEGPFVKQGMKPCKCSDSLRIKGYCFEFGMPEYLVHVLKLININIVSRDNNHIHDYGISAFDFSTNLIESVNINQINPKAPIFLNIKGKKIGFVAFGFNNYSNNVNDLDNTKLIITELKKKCDILYVSFHGGKEGRSALVIKDEKETFLGGNRGNIIKFCRTAIDAGADVVIGHGPHVLRTVEIYKNKLIAYSLGNFITYGNFNLNYPCNITMILNFEIDLKNGDFISGKIVPFKQKKPGIPIEDKEQKAIQLMQNILSKHQNSNCKIKDNGEIIK